MTADGWAELIEQACANPSQRSLLATLLAEQDQAKSRLSQLGFGVTGTPWREVVDEVEKWAEGRYSE